MRSPTLPFLRSTCLTSAVRLLAARCFHRPRAPGRLPMLPCECWEGRTQAASIPPIEFAAPKYDWRQLQRWNISENRLPPGSEVLFREQTVWQHYSWQIALIIAVILLQAGAYRGPATRASSASTCRSAVQAANGRTGPCHALFDRRRTDRLNCTRNQPAARLYSDECRNRRGDPEIPDARHRRTQGYREGYFAG